MYIQAFTSRTCIFIIRYRIAKSRHVKAIDGLERGDVVPHELVGEHSLEVVVEVRRFRTGVAHEHLKTRPHENLNKLCEGQAAHGLSSIARQQP